MFQWKDPYYEAFGEHFANLIERHGVPVIVLNLMKQKEKRRFEQQLTDGYLEGIKYLNQVRPLCSHFRDNFGTLTIVLSLCLNF